MFRKGLCVRSLFGLGQVVVDGDPPLVRFLDGRECHVTEELLTIVPTEDFEAEIANRTLWNRFLTLCVCGRHGLEAASPFGCGMKMGYGQIRTDSVKSLRIGQVRSSIFSRTISATTPA